MMKFHLILLFKNLMKLTDVLTEDSHNSYIDDTEDVDDIPDEFDDFDYDCDYDED